MSNKVLIVDDDDSVFEAENGKKVYVNGSSIIIEE